MSFTRHRTDRNGAPSEQQTEPHYDFGKEDMKRFKTGICILYVLALLVSAAGCSVRADPASSGTAGKDTVTIEITTPSPAELVIAPGRHFKVSGKLTGDVPDDAVLKVSLLDASGKEIRYARTDRKGTQSLVPACIGGDIIPLVPGTDFAEVAFTAPEMAVEDPADPPASSHDATVKCVYTDGTFYALIVSATDTSHGLMEDDGCALTDHEGEPYSAFPEGRYVVRVELFSSGGELIASASEEIEIGFKSGTVIHEVTTSAAIEKGGMELLTSWAAKEDLTVLGDLLPGMYGHYYQMTTLQMAVACESAEYLPGRIMMLVYGNWDMSASNGLEVGKYLQLEHRTDDPDAAWYYYFSLGEPSLMGISSEIVKFGDDEMIHICRIDRVTDWAQDGVCPTGGEQILGSDTDPSDGWSTSGAAFAIFGVMKPYQLEDDEIVPVEGMYGFFRLMNGADKLVYTFTPADGSGEFSVEKPVGVSRPGGDDDHVSPAVYEFYSVFPAGTLKDDTSYDVAVQAYDKNGDAIPGAFCRFAIN